MSRGEIWLFLAARRFSFGCKVVDSIPHLLMSIFWRVLEWDIEHQSAAKRVQPLMALLPLLPIRAFNEQTWLISLCIHLSSAIIPLTASCDPWSCYHGNRSKLNWSHRRPEIGSSAAGFVAFNIVAVNSDWQSAWRMDTHTRTLTGNGLTAHWGEPSNNLTDRMGLALLILKIFMLAFWTSYCEILCVWPVSSSSPFPLL